MRQSLRRLRGARARTSLPQLASPAPWYQSALPSVPARSVAGYPNGSTTARVAGYATTVLRGRRKVASDHSSRAYLARHARRPRGR
eukprot:396981-Rhodomonas_salina.2